MEETRVGIRTVVSLEFNTDGETVNEELFSEVTKEILLDEFTDEMKAEVTVEIKEIKEL